MDTRIRVKVHTPGSNDSILIPGTNRAGRTHPAQGPNGTGRFAADAAAATRGVNAGNFLNFLEHQGDTNGCGTTSLAMLLSFWSGKPQTYTREVIDEKIRQFDAPTSPLNVVRYAEQQGMRASMIDNGSVQQLKDFLDQGVPVQLLYDPNADGSDMVLHYTVATDYTTDAKGNLTGIVMADPGSGKMEHVPIDEFKRRWDDLRLVNGSVKLNNVMFPMVPKENVAIQGKDGQVRMADDIKLPDTYVPQEVLLADTASNVANLAGMVQTSLVEGFNNWVKDVQKGWNNFWSSL